MPGMLDRLVTIQLPPDVSPGRHELVIVLEEQPSRAACITDDSVEKLNDFIKKRYELSLIEPLLDGEKIFTTLAAHSSFAFERASIRPSACSVTGSLGKRRSQTAENLCRH